MRRYRKRERRGGMPQKTVYRLGLLAYVTERARGHRDGRDSDVLKRLVLVGGARNGATVRWERVRSRS